MDRAGIPLIVAFWSYFVGAQEWRLVLATPLVEQVGPRAVYSKVQKILRADPILKTMPLSQITVIGRGDPMTRLGASSLPLTDPFRGGTVTSTSAPEVNIDSRFVYRRPA